MLWLPAPLAAQPLATDTLSAEENAFLDQLQYDTVQYFWDYADPKTGLIPDSSQANAPSSIAATGFGLAALCIADSRGWIRHQDAYRRVLAALKTARRLKQYHGFLYHFVDMRTGQRAWQSEISSIDTALLLAGALFAGEYFKGTEVDRIAQELYERVDWPWMLNPRTGLVSMGWKPEEGFLKVDWDWYNEGLLVYALAIGSPTHPIPPATWFKWRRAKGSYGGYEVVYSYFGSLFTYEFAQAWIDFRNLYEGSLNYWQNAISAALANRQFVMDQAAQHRGYGEYSWGLTAGDGPEGYKGYGARPAEVLMQDGTINPYGMVAALPLVPHVAVESLQWLKRTHGRRVYGRYGFVSGFNLERDWWSRHYLGIDQGISVVMIENYRTGLVWRQMMRHPAIARWAQRCLRDLGAAQVDVPSVAP